jgi:DNA adenine methylase
VSYPGGKNGAGVYQTIINLMPPHEVYIEPFLGGGAILRLKQPASLNIGIDLDSAAIARMREWARHAKSDDALRRPSPGKAITDRQFRFQRGDGIAFLKSYPFTRKELVYCDPPYMPETLQSRCRYKYDLDQLQHDLLLYAIKRLPCRVMISGYWSVLYSLHLKNWNVVKFEAMTRGGHTATEFLWFNFPAPVALHDYSYLGSNFRERERIKRKKLRWVKRLERMPALEKQCLLQAIASIGGSGDSAGGIVSSGDGRRR